MKPPHKVHKDPFKRVSYPPICVETDDGFYINAAQGTDLIREYLDRVRGMRDPHKLS